jgi:hypothetical protein
VLAAFAAFAAFTPGCLCISRTPFIFQESEVCSVEGRLFGQKKKEIKQQKNEKKTKKTKKTIKPKKEKKKKNATRGRHDGHSRRDAHRYRGY